MDNRKAKFLFAKGGQLLRISNRKVVRYAPSGVSFLPAEYYVIDKKPSARQNKIKNHWRWNRD